MEGAARPTESTTEPTPAAPGPARGDRNRVRVRHRFELLLLITLTSFVVQGMVPPSDTQQVVVTALAGASLMLAVHAAEYPQWALRTVTALAAVAFTLSVVHTVAGAIGDGATELMNAALILIAPPSIAIGVIREIRANGQVQFPAVMGALSLYLLLGMLFGFVYGAIDRLGGAPFFSGGEAATGARALYFSFTTLTTVGYGDLTARTDVGHTLSAFEALLGQIYLVTVVAAIVGNLRRPRAEG